MTETSFPRPQSSGCGRLGSKPGSIQKVLTRVTSQLEHLETVRSPDKCSKSAGTSSSPLLSRNSSKESRGLPVRGQGKKSCAIKNVGQKTSDGASSSVDKSTSRTLCRASSPKAVSICSGLSSEASDKGCVAADPSSPSSMLKPPAKAASSCSGFGSEDSQACSGLGTDSDEEASLNEGKPTPKPKPKPKPKGRHRQEEMRTAVYHRGNSAVEAMMKGLHDRFEALESLDAVDKEHANLAELDKKQDELDLSFVRLMTPMQFNSFLKYYGVDLDAYNNGQSRSLRDLWLEVVWQTTNLEKYRDEDSPNGFRIRRLVKLLVVELKATIDGETRFLTLHSEGERKDLNQRVTCKMFCDELEHEALGRCLWTNFELPEVVTRRELWVDEELHHQEVKESASYPGLATIYDMYTLRISISDPNAPSVSKLGLPSGEIFETAKTRGFVGAKTVREWAWETSAVFDKFKRRTSGCVVTLPANGLTEDDAFKKAISVDVRS